jgi:multicomponent Na+:H+ antiporter subunit G
MIDTVIHYLGNALLLIGAASVLIGGVGVIRMPDLYTRMHASSLTDTVASLTLLSGLILHSGLTLATFKLFTVLVFVLLTGPTATYALANAAYSSGLQPPVPHGPAEPGAGAEDNQISEGGDK